MRDTPLGIARIMGIAGPSSNKHSYNIILPDFYKQTFHARARSFTFSGSTFLKAVCRLKSSARLDYLRNHSTFIRLAPTRAAQKVTPIIN